MSPAVQVAIPVQAPITDAARFIVGQDPNGRWSANKIHGRVGGIFRNRKTAADYGEHPFAAVAGLARRAAKRGSGLSTSDFVAVGNCLGLAQVLPGHTPSARLGDLGIILPKLR